MLGLGVVVVLAVAHQQQQDLQSLLLRDLILVPLVEVRLALAPLQQLGLPSLLLAHHQAVAHMLLPMEGGLTLVLGHAQVPLLHSTSFPLRRYFTSLAATIERNTKKLFVHVIQNPRC